MEKTTRCHRFAKGNPLWLANCYFAHDSIGFPALLSFCDAPAGCAWRIVISPMIPQDFPSCYYSSMRNLAVLVIHLIATLARLLGPGGVRSLVAESLLLKHQLLIVNRSRQRSPNLSAGDRILAGLLALLVRPTLCLAKTLYIHRMNDLAQLTRAPRFVAPGTPKNAHPCMVTAPGTNCLIASDVPVTRHRFGDLI